MEKRQAEVEKEGGVLTAMNDSGTAEIKTQRVKWMDTARAAAIMLVILCHATETFYYGVYTGKRMAGELSWLFQNTLFTLGRLGVPIFLMLTGALYLGRELKPLEFYRKKLLPLLLTTEIWIVLNMILHVISSGTALNWTDLVMQMLFLQTSGMPHMWYMPMILGIYVALPFISIITHRVKDLKQFSVIIPAVILFIFFVNMYNAFAGTVFPELKVAALKLNTNFWGGTMGCYLMFGWLLSSGNILKRVKSGILILAFVFFFGVNSAMQYYLYHNGFYTPALIYYDTPNILFMGIILFELASRTEQSVLSRNRVISGSLCWISSYSLAVYFIHMPVLKILNRLGLFISYVTPVKITLYFIIIGIASLLIAFIVSLVPLFRKLLFRMDRLPVKCGISEKG